MYLQNVLVLKFQGGVLQVGALDSNATDPPTTLLEPLFTVEMPAAFGVMTALLLAFIMGLGIAFVKGDTIKNLMNEFQEIINKLISNITIPVTVQQTKKSSVSSDIADFIIPLCAT